MPHVIDQLLALRVADVMAKELVTVSENQTMPQVANILHENEVSSAPVVDDQGRCVGIVTATDFLKRECEYRERENVAFTSSEPRPAERAPQEPYRLVSWAEDFAAYHMTRAVQAISPEASVLKAARMMCAEHIHRLLVIDERNRPVGIVSTMDIVAAVVNVVEQMDEELQRRLDQVKVT